MPASSNQDNQNSQSSNEKRTGSRRNALLRVAATVLLVIGICGCGYVVWEQYHEYKSLQRMQGAEVPKNPVAVEEKELADNPLTSLPCGARTLNRTHGSISPARR